MAFVFLLNLTTTFSIGLTNDLFLKFNRTVFKCEADDHIVALVADGVYCCHLSVSVTHLTTN